MLVHPRATHLRDGLRDGGRLQGASHGLGCARVRARQKRVAMLVRDSIASPRPEDIGNLPVEMGCEGSARGQGYRILGAIGMVVSALPLQKISGREKQRLPDPAHGVGWFDAGSG